MIEVAGKAAVVTGGASGIGRGVCRRLAEAGMRVMVADLDGEGAEKLAAELRTAGADARSAAVDVSDARAVERLADEAFRVFGAVDVLHNNAGVICGGRAQEMSDEDWDWVLSVNVRGVASGCRAFVPRMIAQESGGHVINTASIGGYLAAPGLGVYCASKFAVVGFSETLRQEIEPHGVAVSILAPGGVKTNLLAAVRRQRGDRGEEAGGGREGASGVGALRQALEEGMDPLEVGRQVLEAVRTRPHYIFTHPEFEPAFRAQFDRVLAAFG